MDLSLMLLVGPSSLYSKSDTDELNFSGEDYSM